MAFMSEVQARLNLDTTQWGRAITKTKADVAELANETSRKMRRSWGGDDAIKGLLQGVGIGGVDQAVKTITDYFEKAAEAAKKMEEHTGRMLSALRQRIQFKREMSDSEIELENVKELRKELSKLQALKDSEGRRLAKIRSGSSDGREAVPFEKTSSPLFTEDQETEMRSVMEKLAEAEKNLEKSKRDESIKTQKLIDDNFSKARESRKKAIEKELSLEGQILAKEREAKEQNAIYLDQKRSSVDRSSAHAKSEAAALDAVTLRKQKEKEDQEEKEAWFEREEAYWDRVEQLKKTTAKTEADTILSTLTNQQKITALLEVQLDLKKRIAKEGDPLNRYELRSRLADINSRLESAQSSVAGEGIGGRLTLEQVGHGRAGRRSERERIAARSLGYEDQADKAEAIGNMSRASRLRGLANIDAKKAGFHSKKGQAVHDAELTKVMKELLKKESVK